jgi:short-subunit dehydrogenase
MNMSSLFAFDPLVGWALYGSTKNAVEGISQGLAKELEPFGIKVTAIEPGLFRTDPSKLAAVVVKLGHTENPPLHLPIGTDSVNNYKISAERLAQDVNTWMNDSLSTDYHSN